MKHLFFMFLLVMNSLILFGQNNTIDSIYTANIGKYIFDFQTERGLVPVFVELKKNEIVLNGNSYLITSQKEFKKIENGYCVSFFSNDIKILLFFVKQELIAIETCLNDKKRTI